MAMNSKSAATKSLPVALCILAACAPSPRLFLQYGGEFKAAEMDRLLAESPLAAGENIQITTLGRSESASHHLVQVRDREAPHVHKNHDLTVAVMKGRGYLMLDRRRIDLIAGDILFIPRRAVHYFVNTSSAPAVALAVFSPAFDGKDTLEVDR